MYKDLVKLLQTNDHLTDQQLKLKVRINSIWSRWNLFKEEFWIWKGEYYFENDTLIEGGEKGGLTNDTSYSEVTLN